MIYTALDSDKGKRLDALCAEVDESYIIGDCNNVGQIYHAVNAGYYAAREV